MADDTMIVVDMLACLSAGLSAAMLLLAVWRVACGRFPGALAAGGQTLLAASTPGLWWGADATAGAVAGVRRAVTGSAVGKSLASAAKRYQQTLTYN